MRAVRLVNRLLAALLALGLLGVALLTAIEVVGAVVDEAPVLVPYDDWLSALRTTPWQDNIVRIVAGSVVALGVVLIFASLGARDRRFVLPTELPNLTLTTSPRAVARMLRRRAEMVSGVKQASAVVTRHRARVVALVPLGDPDRAEEELYESLSAALGSVPWKKQPTLYVGVQARSGRRAEV